MNQLYPIIRRKRRPLLLVDAPPVVGGDETLTRPAVAPGPAVVAAPAAEPLALTLEPPEAGAAKPGQPRHAKPTPQRA
jgi:hypothetical protein